LRTKSSLRSDFLEYIKLYLIYYKKVNILLILTNFRYFISKMLTSSHFLISIHNPTSVLYILIKYTISGRLLLNV
jgi:hypothetical protein